MISTTPIKTPRIIKKLFPKYIWDLYDIGDNKIYLTFDDGPVPHITEFVLDQLDQYNAKATFFCIGDNIQKHPDIFNQILSAGHTIGNHTMNHLKAWKNTHDRYIQNVIDCENITKEYSNIRSTQRLFRPPYGQISLSKFKTLENTGYKIILWDVLSMDWEKTILPEECLQNVIKNTKKGSIVVFHDSVKASKNLIQTLPLVLEHFTKKGFVFDSIQF
ncbi:polysaccharide deacetylase family protein [Aquimarina muelleri]|uniref:Polysaccharide deacetylase n=1 Tax=Aquimarina muelleri TaxID=279356 RepID=A0A918JTW6_9FLAO|nr:polysaccharide deacetylase family protein [Aquimarina muelleri]MCX2761414.1 polysaccharide deacetylase family protein [Aquimarina muelleri]GGX13507.1 polysaccharide deacetylase [Aquimarina muelleri]